MYDDAYQASLAVKKNLSSSIKGIVIVGGYDVVPSLQLDVLDQDMRDYLEETDEINDDQDGFIIWSDDIYADNDGDLLPEWPVSRIPDGKSAALIFNALGAKPYQADSKFGIRNLVRPFAIDIYESIISDNSHGLEVSEHCSPHHIDKEKARGAVYYMLHGSDTDATKYWGEKGRGGFYEAIDISNIPDAADHTVIFSGCCWGALTVQPPAFRYISHDAVYPLTPDQSIALAYLKSGASAFVGCTGTHYSPSAPPYNFFGKPLHNLFWKNIGMGMQASQALFEAKKRYASDMPHGLEKEVSKAIEMKIFRQFTCLGLGW